MRKQNKNLFQVVGDWWEGRWVSTDKPTKIKPSWLLARIIVFVLLTLCLNDLGMQVDAYQATVDPSASQPTIKISYNQIRYQLYESGVVARADGVHSFAFSAEDIAGNVSPNQTLTIELDLYPAQPASESFYLCGSVIPAVAGTSSSGNFQLTTSAGEMAVGQSGSSGFQLSSGFLSQRNGCSTEPLPLNGYVLQRDVIGAAGGLVTSSSFQLNGTLGETFVGSSAESTDCLESASFRLGVGFWGCGGVNTTAPLTQQTIVLEAGWNIISSYVIPSSADLSTLFADINEHISIVKNNEGQVYWPAFNVNQIGSWDSQQGYQIHVTSATTLTVSGTPVNAASISLPAGWNLIPYWNSEALPIETVLASLGNKVVIVKNSNGQVYWPEFGVNDIGDMRPGQGYQLYLREPATLSFP
ncbi:MAG: hypothetical protein ACPG8W_09020 [Candidatus Promineifilaceae bacterium]